MSSLLGLMVGALGVYLPFDVAVDSSRRSPRLPASPNESSESKLPKSATKNSTSHVKTGSKQLGAQART